MKTVSIVLGATASTMSLASAVTLLFLYYPSPYPTLTIPTGLVCLGAALLGSAACVLSANNHYIISGVLYVLCTIASILFERPMASIIFPIAAVLTFILPFLSSSKMSVPTHKTIAIIAGAISIAIAVGVMFFGYCSGMFENETIPGHREWLEMMGTIFLLLGSLSLIGGILGIIGGVIGSLRRKLSYAFLIT
ncbi:MAG: hypothetical protein AAGU32_18495, partial [Bacillota bacterium]